MAHGFVEQQVDPIPCLQEDAGELRMHIPPTLLYSEYTVEQWLPVEMSNRQTGLTLAAAEG